MWAEDLQHLLVIAEGQEARTELLRLCMNEGYQASPVAGAELVIAKPDASVDLILMVVDDAGRALEKCGELRALEALRSVGILLVTPQPPQPEQAAAALLAGADDYCSFHLGWRIELRARLRVHLRNKRMREAVHRLRGERNNLRSRAGIDTLTGALGRRALGDAVQRSLDGAAPFAVLFVDIDHFKRVNDTYGHQIGDLALQRVAETLTGERRAGDVCGRYGGEEFVLVVSKVQPHEALRVAERHRRAVAALRLGAEGGPERITVSIGVAVFDVGSPDPTVASILSRADTALYQAKRSGRDCVLMAEPYSPETPPQAEQAMQLRLDAKTP
ncbi:MAG TPA: GGDEF domain-containing protein [Polyangiaceae bacterium]|nr:GGDEF domain-containing protein [Polyangiaceae bacterium]